MAGIRPRARSRIFPGARARPITCRPVLCFADRRCLRVRREKTRFFARTFAETLAHPCNATTPRSICLENAWDSFTEACQAGERYNSAVRMNVRGDARDRKRQHENIRTEVAVQHQQSKSRVGRKPVWSGKRMTAPTKNIYKIKQNGRFGPRTGVYGSRNILFWILQTFLVGASFRILVTHTITTPGRTNHFL